MKCPFCESDSSSVKDSRETANGTVIRRRRCCAKCGGKFTTFERMQLTELLIIKRTGAKRPFDRDKIFKAVMTALRKRNFSNDKIEEITDKITLEIQSSNSREIHSRQIGKLIMEELSQIDPVAYIRFASVYKDFATVQDFARFISKIKHTS